QRQLLRPAVTGALLDLAQLAPEPEFVARPVEDDAAVARGQRFFVKLTDLGLVAFENGVDDFQVLAKQGVAPRPEPLGVPLVGDEINLGRAPGCGCGLWRRRRIALEPVEDRRTQVLER